MARPNERVQFWRGYSEAMGGVGILSGQLLFQEDTGDVFLDYRDTHEYLPHSTDPNPNYGQLIRIKLTDTDKANIYGDTFTGQVFLFPEYTVPIEDNEAVPKKYVDDIGLNLQNQIDEHVNNQEIHITQQERETWNNKVDKEDGKGLSTNDFTDELKEKVEKSTHVEYQPGYQVDEDNQDQFYDLGTLLIDEDTYHIYSPIQHDIDGNASTATKLLNKVSLDGVLFDGSDNVCRFGSCNSFEADQVKEVNIDNFDLVHGAYVIVKFNLPNQATDVKLDVSGTGPYPIEYLNNDGSSVLGQGIFQFIYLDEAETGLPSRYELVGGVDTTYTLADSTHDGLLSKEDYTKLQNIEDYANNYVLPEATTSSLGGVIVGKHIHVTGDGTISVERSDVIDALGFTPLSPDGFDIDSMIETIGIFEGSDLAAEKFGQVGLVPAPSPQQQFYFLSGSGTWKEVPAYHVFTQAENKVVDLLDDDGNVVKDEFGNVIKETIVIPGKDGLVPAPDITDGNKVLCSDGSWISVDGVTVTPITKEEIDEMLKDLELGIGSGSCNCQPIPDQEIQDIIDGSSIENLETMTEDEITDSFNAVFGGSNA